MPRRIAVRASAVVLGLVVLTVACGSTNEGGGDGTTVAVTTPILGAVVSELVGEHATVEVVVPDGVDPHDFRPSAQDLAGLSNADIIVMNGAGLEGGLVDTIDAAADENGTPVFVATDQIELRSLGPGEAVDDHGDEVEGGGDPHFWVDPVAMQQVVAALGDDLAGVGGVDIRARADEMVSELNALNNDVTDTLASIPTGRRVLVTGHESLGYFADRYGFTLVGAIIPSTTSQAASSAGQLAALKAEIERYAVPVIFNEIGTPPAVAEAIASETGARVVELATHTLPEDGSYITFLRDLAAGVADGLSPP